MPPIGNADGDRANRSTDCRNVLAVVKNVEFSNRCSDIEYRGTCDDIGANAWLGFIEPIRAEKSDYGDDCEYPKHIRVKKILLNPTEKLHAIPSSVLGISSKSYATKES